MTEPIQHSPEPWILETTTMGGGYNYMQFSDANGNPIFCDGSVSMRDEDGRRIDACVNFLAGIPTKELDRLSALPQCMANIAGAYLKADPTVHAAIRECLADLYDSHTAQYDREKAVETIEAILFQAKLA